MADADMIEAMARAIYERVNGSGCRPWRQIDHKPAYRDQATAALAVVQPELDRLRNLVAILQQQAEIHAQEARTANATIYEAYQAVTGATGEPGNWNGARPIRGELDRLRAENARLREALEPFAREADNWNDNVAAEYRPLQVEPQSVDHANGGYAHPGSESAFSVGDIRRARTALSAPAHDGEGR